MHSTIPRAVPLLLIAILPFTRWATADEKGRDLFDDGTKPPQVDLIDHLLSLPADAPMWKPRDPYYVPPDNVPLFELLEFRAPQSEEHSVATYRSPGPTPMVQRRLLAACVEQAKYLRRILRYLAESAETADAVKALMDRPQDKAGLDDDSRQAAHAWLKYHSRYFRDELIAELGRKGAEHAETPDHALEALTRLDWKLAEPLLVKRSQGEDVTSAWAGGQLYLHALGEADHKGAARWRQRLMRMVENTKVEKVARENALLPLLQTQWEGKLDWVETPLADPAFLQVLSIAPLDPTDPYATIRRAASPDLLNPDRFVPVLVRIAGGPPGDARNTAVARLLDFPRPDAVAALLPWLEAPKWATVQTLFGGSKIDGKEKVLEMLATVDVPASVPVLRKLAEGAEASDLTPIALALAHQRADKATTLVRKAVDAIGRSQGGGWGGRRRSPEGKLVQLAVERGVLSERDVARCIEAYARSRENRNQGGLFAEVRAETPESHDAHAGEALLEVPPAKPAIIIALLDRWSALCRSQPKVADSFWEIVSTWPDGSVDERIVQCLSEEPLEAGIVWTAIKRAANIRALPVKELRTLVARGGERAGVAAMLLAEPETTGAILHGADMKATRILLACARVGRTALPVPDVGQLLKSKDKKTALAAEEYLSCVETAEARNLVWSHRAGDCVVLGALWCQYLPASRIDQATDPDNRFREELKKENAPDDIFILSHTGSLSGTSEEIIVRRRGGAGTLELHPWGAMGKSLTRKLNPGELSALLDFIAQEHCDELPQIESGVVDGEFNEYLHFTRAGGRRVIMHNPGADATAGSPHFRLVMLFRHLADAAPLETHYFQIERVVPTVRVLYTDTGKSIGGLWKADNRLLVRVGEIWKDGPWHVFRDGKIAETAAAPFEFVTVDPVQGDDHADDFYPASHSDDNRWKAVAGGEVIIASETVGGFQKKGLFRWRKPNPPQRITELSTGDPVATYDGKFAVASVGKDLVSVEISSGRVQRLKLPADREYDVCLFIPVVNKVLARGDKKEGDAIDSQYFLIDAEAATACAGKG